jgi:Rieske Fe-S protein
LQDGGFLALHRECTHLGCTVPWVSEEKRFMCPCHSSVYDINGDVLSPPAPRALDLASDKVVNHTRGLLEAHPRPVGAIVRGLRARSKQSRSWEAAA